MILIIDNYDSFTYNLVQILNKYTSENKVIYNDELTVNEIAELKPSQIVISPGPGRPESSGVCPEVIKNLGDSIPILGVCLGHQIIGQTFACGIIRAPSLMHGKISRIHHDNKGIFREIENPFEATRYHSLVIDPATLPPELILTAKTEDNVIMGIRHKDYPLEGIQFHPESILTTQGENLMKNWLFKWS